MCEVTRCGRFGPVKAREGMVWLTRLATIFVGLCLALLPTSAMALSFGFSASYEEDGTTTGTNPDFYSFTNDVLSETQILEIVLDLSGGLAVYDPIGAPF